MKIYVGQLPYSMTEEELKEMLLRDSYFKEKISLPNVAESLDIQPYQLSHFINNYMGMSFTNFINGIRIEEAKKYFNEKPKATVLDIAYEAGFNSKASFNRAFKKFTKMTPSQFRNNFQ